MAPVRVFSKDQVLRTPLSKALCHRRCLEGVWKAETRPFAEYNSLRVHPIQLSLFLWHVQATK